jgi:hypothetical protein
MLGRGSLQKMIDELLGWLIVAAFLALLVWVALYDEN